MSNLEIYTDGACDDNTRGANNIGGYSFVVTENGGVIHKSRGNYRITTNNRMELRAVIEALKFASGHPTKHVTIYSDSQYVVNTVNCKWKRKINHDLWDDLYSLLTEKIKLVWVKGHDGNRFNEMADKLATRKDPNIKMIPLDVSDIPTLETLFA